MLSKNKKNKGFTLIELLVTLFVFSVGILGAYLIIQRLSASIEYAKNRLIAIYLAQEGIEIVKNLRDTNWLRAVEWDEGIPVGDNFGVEYNNLNLFSGFGSLNLEIDNQGFYQYGGEKETPFKRKIKITKLDTPLGEDIIQVEVSVSWSDKFSPVVITQKLYNWLP